MGASKRLLLKDKELRESWAAVAHSAWFARVITHCRAELMDSRINTDGLEGARRYEDILLSIADDEVADTPFPGIGLHHDIDIHKEQADEKPH